MLIDLPIRTSEDNPMADPQMTEDLIVRDLRLIRDKSKNLQRLDQNYHLNSLSPSRFTTENQVMNLLSVLGPTEKSSRLFTFTLATKLL
jgi:hypothetical protein